MADKDGRKRTLSAQISQWEQQKLFSRHFQDSKYVGEKNTFSGGWWSDFSPLLICIFIWRILLRLWPLSLANEYNLEKREYC